MPDDQLTGRALDAGPELDAEIDRVVFGKSWVLHPYCVINGRRKDVPTWLPDEDWCSPDDPPGGWTWGETPPSFSSNIAVAFQLVEHFRARGWLVTVKDMPDGFPYWLDNDGQAKLHRRSICDMEWMERSSPEGVRRFMYRHPHGIGDTPAEAIARCALDAADAEAEVTDDEVRAAWKLPADSPLIPLIGGPEAAGPAHDGAEGAGA